jgi:hypothetical protein
MFYDNTEVNMKNLLIVVLFLFFVPILFADDTAKQLYPLKYEFTIYPTDIQYGDIVFTSVCVQNKGKLALSINYDQRYQGYPMNAYTLWDDKLKNKIYTWMSQDDFEQRGYRFNYGISNYTKNTKTAVILPNQTMEVSFRPVWIPLHDWLGTNFRKALTLNFEGLTRTMILETVLDIRTDYQPTWSVKDAKWIIFDGGHHLDGHGETNNIVPYSNQCLGNHGFKTDQIQLQMPFNVKQRNEQTYKLLRDWYKEMPGSNLWTDGVLFSYVHHDRNSPYYVDDNVSTHEELSNELRQRRDNNRNFAQISDEFEKTATTRSEFVIKRINHTNELAAKLLKLPDSELSQNMKEFIQLRGLLVDIRFAEDEKAEEIAFNELITFVNKAKDKKLWIKFVGEIAFDSILDYQYFPRKKIDTYRKRWIEKFEDKTEVKEVSKK